MRLSIRRSRVSDVPGHVIECIAENALVELGEGIRANCTVSVESEPAASRQGESKLDLSALSSMLSARWKGETKALGAQAEPIHVGQVRNFKIATIDRDTKQISLELTM